MTKEQLSAAMRIVEKTNESLLDVDISIFLGYGLPDFKAIYCTIRQLAALIRWDCLLFNGEVNGQALDELCKIARIKFSVL